MQVLTGCGIGCCCLHRDSMVDVRYCVWTVGVALTDHVRAYYLSINNSCLTSSSDMSFVCFPQHVKP